MTIREPALIVEAGIAESFAAENVAEVHVDRDLTWLIHPGDFWRNAGVMARFSAAAAERRLDAIVDRYRANGRGMGMWVFPAATPANLPELLRARRFRCRKYYPAMLRRLDKRERSQVPSGIEIRQLHDVAEFRRGAYPSIGPITTPLRATALKRLAELLADPRQRTVAFVVYERGHAVGATELFVGASHATLNGLHVLESHRGRGFGTALLEQACAEAASRGAATMGLIATNDGERLYSRREFVEAARVGWWYRSFQWKVARARSALRGRR
jgi:GNAT superfamily N-acetyltransferase